MKKTKLEEKVIDAMEQTANGNPLKDFLDKDEIIDALLLLVEYIEVYHLKTPTEQQNVDIHKELVQEIHKYVIDETGYLISLPNDVIAGILKLVQRSSLTAEEPWTWFDLEEHGPPDDDVSVITWNGHDLAFDMWSNKESQNLNVERMLASLGDVDFDVEPRKVTHWMYKPTPPKE